MFICCWLMQRNGTDEGGSGFNSINVLSVLEKAVWQRAFRERAAIRVKQCQVTPLKAAMWATF